MLYSIITTRFCVFIYIFTLNNESLPVITIAMNTVAPKSRTQHGRRSTRLVFPVVFAENHSDSAAAGESRGPIARNGRVIFFNHKKRIDPAPRGPKSHWGKRDYVFTLWRVINSVVSSGRIECENAARAKKNRSVAVKIERGASGFSGAIHYLRFRPTTVTHIRFWRV